VQLVSLTSNAICKEQDISLQPRNFLGRILKTSSWAAHFATVFVMKRIKVVFDGIELRIKKENK
jgi:hypothetical protein